MNGKKAKFLRKQLSIKKPTEASKSGLYRDYDECGNSQLKFRRRSNPDMNMYRHVKRVITRGR